MNTIIMRAKAPTPKFFRTLRTIGLLLATIGGSIVAAPVALPVAIVTAGSYLIAVGTVISAVSQITVKGNANTLSKKALSNGN